MSHSLFTSFTSILLFILPALLASCGKTQQKVSIADLSATASDPSCRRNNCPEIDFSVVGNKDLSLETTIAAGAVGKKIDWNIKAVSKGMAGRIKILVIERPLWIQQIVDPKSSGVILFDGIPDAPVAKNFIPLLVRDIGRCRALEVAPKECESASARFKEYDKEYQLNYQITGSGAGTNGTNGTTTTTKLTGH